MQYYKVEFTISSDGTITEKVLNGSSNCTELTKDLELGKVESQELLAEYHQQINQEIPTNQEDNLWQGF